MRKKLDNVCSADETHLALDCPGCTIQLRGGADRDKRAIEVVHVAEVLAAALESDEKDDNEQQGTSGKIS